MNVEIGADAALFPEKEYISRILLEVQYVPKQLSTTNKREWQTCRWQLTLTSDNDSTVRRFLFILMYSTVVLTPTMRDRQRHTFFYDEVTSSGNLNPTTKCRQRIFCQPIADNVDR
jgi:hypothetical protein